MSKPIPGLKYYREKKLLTQAELAHKSKLTQGVISRAEAGQKISLGAIKKLARGLNINPDKLLLKEDQPQ